MSKTKIWRGGDREWHVRCGACQSHAYGHEPWYKWDYASGHYEHVRTWLDVHWRFHRSQQYWKKTAARRTYLEGREDVAREIDRERFDHSLVCGESPSKKGSWAAGNDRGIGYGLEKAAKIARGETWPI